MGKKSADSVLMSDLPAVSPEHYRDAMSHFAGAVHILTTQGGKGLRGVTVSACCSLSDNPPTLLVCLMKQHSSNQLFIENGHFCINTLSGRHQELSDIFAGKGELSQEKRFAKAKWRVLKTGSPVLQGALASFDCRLVGWHDHATHYILHGQVVAIQRNNAKEALLYLNRGYHKLAL